MDDYHEIFLGGGSVLFGLLSLEKEGIIKIKNKIHAYDYNKPLIYVYKNIQAEPKEFLKTIIKIINEYNSIKQIPKLLIKSDINDKISKEKKKLNDIGKKINQSINDNNFDKNKNLDLLKKENEQIENIKNKLNLIDMTDRNPFNQEQALVSKESYYYWIRKKYNNMNDNEKISILGSAYFVFLNKTCFRGVFRMGPNGFNVPFGNYDNPSIITKSHIKEISKLIKNVEFIHSSFEDSLKNVKKGAYNFFDPPYFPMNATSFVGYTSDGFNQETHEKLFKMLHELKKQDIKWMMSNSSAEYVLDCFDDKKKYSLKKILCKRAINSKNPESKVNEVIIKSY